MRVSTGLVIACCAATWAATAYGCSALVDREREAWGRSVARQKSADSATVAGIKLQAQRERERSDSQLATRARELRAAQVHAEAIDTTLGRLRKQARTASDSAKLVPVLEQAIRARDDQIVALVDGRREVLASRDSAYAAFGRLSATVDTIIETRIVEMPASAISTQKWRFAERAALVVVTAETCRRHPLTVGCAVGAIATVLVLK